MNLGQAYKDGVFEFQLVLELPLWDSMCNLGLHSMNDPDVTFFQELVSIMQNYRILSKKGEGTFSHVMVGLSLLTRSRYAIKCIKKKFESIEDVNNLPELVALRRLSRHQNIIRLNEVLFQRKHLALVFELMDMNLYEAIKDRKAQVPETQILSWMLQLFRALEHVHDNGVFHRDVKPENLLLRGHILKLADLGSCCFIGSTGPPFTEYISTRWYRAPECLLTSGFYGLKMDIWAAGCVLYEVATLKPLFPGKNEIDQIHQIHSVLGTPDEQVLEGFRDLPGDHLRHINFPATTGSGFVQKLTHRSKHLISLLTATLTYDPAHRPCAKDCLQSQFFKTVEPPTVLLDPRIPATTRKLQEATAHSPTSTCVSPAHSIATNISVPDVPPLPDLTTFTCYSKLQNAVFPKRSGRTHKLPNRKERNFGFSLPSQRKPHDVDTDGSKISYRKPRMERFRNFSQIYRLKGPADAKENSTKR
jgi:renal tumor antigen